MPITNQENDYPSEMRVVSTTDLKGITVYANEDFREISGFSNEELIGKSHNIVRHPDMPPAAFNDLWENIKAGKSWMGIVKNRCKNGDYYWVDAFVTPTIENGTVTGYQSVRLKPQKSHVRSAEKFYKTLWSPASAISQLIEKITPNLTGKIVLTNIASLLSGIITMQALNSNSGATLFIPAAVMLITGIVLASFVARPWVKAAKETKDIYDNAVARQVYTGRQDELGQLQSVIKMQQAQQETIVWRIGDSTQNLQTISSLASQATLKTEQEMNNQTMEVEQVATAMNEMTATVHEVAQNAALTANSTEMADQEVIHGKNTVDQTIDRINNLAEEVETAVHTINKLAEDTNQIGSVVDVIRGVSEQTNLLALNAAIEAARAGEQGRGFAVVADEVRTLAGRTQAATTEIQEMIESLQNSATQAADVMKQSQQSATDSVEKAQEAGQSLETITDAVKTINDMSAQIATAAEEQSAVSEEINRNITNISMATDQTLSATKETSQTNSELSDSIQRLNTMVKQFGI